MTADTPSAWDRAQQAQAKYQEALLALPHVVGVAVGYATVAGQDTTEPAVIVMVDQKLPEGDLLGGALIPRRLDGVRVDVQEFGTFATL